MSLSLSFEAYGGKTATASQQQGFAGSKDGAGGMVVGSRAHLEDAAIATRHWYRNFLMRGFHLLVLFVAGGSVRDTQCGFKVLHFLFLLLHDLALSLQMLRTSCRLYLCLCRGYAIRSLAISSACPSDQVPAMAL